MERGPGRVYASKGGSFSQFAGMKVRGIEMRLTTRIWFWFLAIPLLAVGSFALSFGFWSALDRTAGGTPVNVWGDMEGLVLAVWAGAGILFLIGMFGLIRWAIESGSGRSGTHSSGEFGQMPSQAIKGLDPPMIGAAASITLDGIVERESGATPSPGACR